MARPDPGPTILFRDTRFVVIDKPAGLAAHPSRAGGASVEDWFPLFRAGRGGPWLAHRLDRDTAGCLLIALRKRTLLEAQALFAAGAVEKTYWAVVLGAPNAAAGRIEAPLGRVRARTGWRMAVDPTGPRAVTAWRVMARGDGVTWLALHPETGRTHQIRAHAAALGHPILGDPVYGGGDGPMHLLARALRLGLTPEVVATAPVPTALRAGFARAGWCNDRADHH
jgi:tRNA pseudouridine32 synthase/23S rRNA pseudouridine746 synthase